MDRREFLKQLIAGGTGIILANNYRFAFAGAPYIKKSNRINKMIILGIDGMDPSLLNRFIQEGIMPNFGRLMIKGDFKTLGTSLPPQSPVAWSNFITGMNPGGHGIFDFIHRDPTSFTPYFSMTRTQLPSKKLALGQWQIPLKPGKVELLRQGPAFWTFLEDHDIPATIVKMPANYPPVPCKSNTISCMGTPDLLGTYGTFSYYTDAPPKNANDFTGGIVYPIVVNDDRFTAKVVGPVNTFRKDDRNSTIDFTVYRDATNPVAKIVIQGQEILLNQGEWSSWIKLTFQMLPQLQHLSGICRFYLKQIRPQFKLYMTPVNIDPGNPALPICTPDNYSRRLNKILGPFYTQGFPEDTKALSHDVFTDEEYLVQANLVLAERLRLFDHELDNFSEGLFFFYFSSIDQNSHMMLRTMDERHPLYNASASPEVKGALRKFYMAMDRVLAQTMGKIDRHTTLIILSDHGFVPFYKEFHLSSWLVENGYAALYDASKRDDSEFFDNVDWSRTRAYALGLNSLYINQKGRELNGVVDPTPVNPLIDEIKTKLESYVDPENGKKIVARAYKPGESYTGNCIHQAPDLIIGYHPGYRISDTAALGKFPRQLVEIRHDKWSADHCMDPRAVPGVLLANKKIIKANPALEDLASAILLEFGIEPPVAMGRNLVFDT